MDGQGSFARLLSDVSGRLGTAAGSASVADVVLPAVVSAFGADVGTVALYRAPSTLHLVGTVGLDPASARAQDWAEFDVSTEVPMAEVARTAEPVWIPDADRARADYPAWPPSSPSRSLCVVPMCSDGRLVGVLGLAWYAPRSFTDEEKDTLCTVGSIAAAAFALDGRSAGRRLGIVDSDTDRDDVHLAHLVRSGLSAVPRTVGTVVASGAPTLSWLVEAPNDAALEIACEGVLALARRHGTPPGIAAQHVVELAEELGGQVSGVAVQVGPHAGWIAVAGIAGCVVLSTPLTTGASVRAAGPGPTPVDEHVVVPDTEGATVLALLLAPGAHPGADPDGDAVVRLARAEVERRRGAAAEDLLGRVAERLGEHGVDTRLLGALAVVVAPRPEPPPLRRRLPARPIAVPLARRFALAALGPQADGDVAFRLGVAVDELVSNATRHADSAVDLVVQLSDEHVVVEVTDDDDRPPSRLPTRPGGPAMPESGRGLRLLDAVVVDWGVRVRAQGGKTVWARVAR